MKQLKFILLAAGLLGLIVWFFNQQNDIRTIRDETERLEKIVETARSGDRVGRLASSGGRAEPVVDSDSDKEPAKLDLKSLLDAGVNAVSGRATSAEAEAFENSLRAMTQEEVLAALDQISRLDLPLELKGWLEWRFFPQLSVLDPKRALDHFSQLPHERLFMTDKMGLVLGRWASNDLAAAIAWLDTEIEAGVFETTNLADVSNIRCEYEKNLAGLLLGKDPEGLQRRMINMSQPEAENVMTDLASKIKGPDQDAAFAEVTRNVLPAQASVGVLARRATRLWDDYPALSGFFGRIDATEEELEECSKKVALERVNHFEGTSNKIEEINGFIAWARSAGVSSADAVVGGSLAEAANRNGLKFEDACAIIFNYAGTDAGQRMRASFLENDTRLNNGVSRENRMLEFNSRENR